MIAQVTDIVYLVSAVLFIVGIKMLSSPSTAARGNYLSALAMALTVGVTLLGGGSTSPSTAKPVGSSPDSELKRNRAAVKPSGRILGAGAGFGTVTLNEFAPACTT